MSGITEKQKRRVIDTAVARFGDSPSLEKTIVVAVELYPRLAAPAYERPLRAWVSFALSEAYKQHRFLRAAALERGLSASLTIREIRDTFTRVSQADAVLDEREQALPVARGARTGHDAQGPVQAGGRP